MKRVTWPRVFAVVAVFFLSVAVADRAAGESTVPREIVIHYRAGTVALPAPHREGNTYVIAIPQSLQPRPQTLVAPFTNDVEEGAEVWRFEIDQTTRVKVTELENGTIRVRLENAATPAKQAALSQSEKMEPISDKPVEEPAPDSHDQKLKTTLRPVAENNSMVANVDANGAALTVAEVAADPDAATVKNKTLPLANLDLSVPTSPAFAILGVTPDNVIRPTSPRELGMALLNGVGKDGTFQGGVALDTAPYLLFAGRYKTLADYREHYSIQFLSRTQFSFATVKGAQDKDPSLKLALGLHFIFFDNGDPRLDDTYISELSKAYDSIGFIDPTDPSAGANAQAKWQALVAKARKEAKLRNWNKSSWSLGLAPSWIDKAGDSGHYDWNGGAVWTSLAYGFDTEPFLNTGLDKSSQLILHLRYRNHEQIPDPAATGSFYTEDSALAALRLRVGSPDFNVALDGAYVREWNSGLHDGNSWRLAFILERKMAANLWFHLSYGKEFNTPDDKDSSLVVGSFHLGASEEAAAPAAQP